jgi:hypothetical protein
MKALVLGEAVPAPFMDSVAAFDPRRAGARPS